MERALNLCSMKCKVPNHSMHAKYFPSLVILYRLEHNDQYYFTVI